MPAETDERTAPVSEHPALPADVTANVTAPVPEPPAVERVRVDPMLTVLSTMVNGACAIAGPPLLSQVAM